MVWRGAGFPPEKSVKMTINGKEYEAPEKIPLSAFLFSKGIKFVSTSTKYYRPRGIVGLDTFNRTTLLKVNGVPNVNPNSQLCEDGLRVEFSTKRKPLILKFSESMLEAGFQHRRFIREPFIWKIVEKFIFKYANYQEEPVEGRAKAAEVEPLEHIKADVAVVGGGLAGLSAAIEARKKGLLTLLIDDQVQVGGRSRYDSFMPEGFEEPLSEYVKKLEREARESGVNILNRTVFLGFWEDGATAYKINEPAGGKLFIVDARVFILATGMLDLPCVYENNDLPGSITASTALRLVNEYGVYLGGRVIQLGLTYYSARVAKQIAEKGTKVTILVKDESLDTEMFKELLDSDGIEIITGVESVRAEGKGKVEKVVVFTSQGEKRIEADYIVFGAMEVPNFRLPAQAGVETVYFDKIGFVPVHSENMETNVDNILVAGSVTGTMNEYLRVLEGRIAGLTAAIKLGVDAEDERRSIIDTYLETAGRLGHLEVKERIFRSFKGEEKIEDLVEDVPTWFSSSYSGKQFVCFCEDITLKDLFKTVTEVGFERMELIKRYTGIATGRCQGRLCLVNASLITARITGESPNTVGLIRQRVPIIPIPYRVISEGDGE